jgi:hypothetical protein
VATTARTRPGLLVAIVVVAFAACWGGEMSLKLSTNATDVPRYRDYGVAVRHGDVPYRDFRVEYPPGALPAFVAPALVRTDVRGYRIAFEVLLAVFAVCLLLVTAPLARRAGSPALGADVFVGAGTLALGPVTLGHYDLWPALLVSGFLAALLGGRRVLSAVLLGCAIAAKLYAVVLLPLAFIWLLRRHGRSAATRAVAIAVGVAALWFLPFLVLSPGGLWWSISEQASRPLQLESGAASVLLVAHHLFGVSLGVDFSHTSVNLGGRLADAAATATTIAELAVLVAVWFAFARRARPSGETLVRATLAAVLAFVLLGKVFSPQFMLWLVPLAPLLGGSFGYAGIAGIGGAVLLTRAYFPRQWLDLILFKGEPTALLACRNLALAALLAAALRLVWSRDPAPARPDEPG